MASGPPGCFHSPPCHVPAAGLRGGRLARPRIVSSHHNFPRLTPFDYDADCTLAIDDLRDDTNTSSRTYVNRRRKNEKVRESAAKQADGMQSGHDFSRIKQAVRGRQDCVPRQTARLQPISEVTEVSTSAAYETNRRDAEEGKRNDDNHLKPDGRGQQRRDCQ